MPYKEGRYSQPGYGYGTVQKCKKVAIDGSGVGTGIVGETQAVDPPSEDASNDQLSTYELRSADDMKRMIRLIEQLVKLKSHMDRGLRVDLVLQSLSDSFSGFIMNFHINKLSCSLPELLNMLVTAQNVMANKRKDKEIILVANASSSKTPRKKKMSKKGLVPSSSVGVSKNKGKAKVVVNKGTCFHCGNDGNWKRNCL
ncbi:hypothetical protein CRG98_042222 [Punica granatum]|uniref:CCHC-type domain-containing protein n=1 Tax=Punica granatum TaxID=22663 RepID=A0A2I0I0M0_PUNGR|nr:hypothetical protein CRG98_042222 [Punica granatum]